MCYHLAPSITVEQQKRAANMALDFLTRKMGTIQNCENFSSKCGPMISWEWRYKEDKLTERSNMLLNDYVKWKEESMWLISVTFSYVNQTWHANLANKPSQQFLADWFSRLLLWFKVTCKRGTQTILLNINPLDDIPWGPNMLVSSSYMWNYPIISLSLWLTDACVFGETVEIVNVGNLILPRPRESSESWESGIEKQGQGNSCQTPIHTIWMESDTTDSWGSFCHSQG